MSLLGFIHVEIRAYWRAGTGRGQGALLDAVALRDTAGLPFLPGRTVKGLVRDAVWRLERWGHVPAHSAHRLFGTSGFIDGVPRTDTEPGALAFSDAQLPAALRAWLAEDSPDFREALFREVHATAIAETGSALDRSLRGMEVAVPMRLTAEVAAIHADRLPADWEEALKLALTLVRAVGASRSRGLGRASLSWEGQS